MDMLIQRLRRLAFLNLAISDARMQIGLLLLLALIIGSMGLPALLIYPLQIIRLAMTYTLNLCKISFIQLETRVRILEKTEEREALLWSLIP